MVCCWDLSGVYECFRTFFAWLHLPCTSKQLAVNDHTQWTCEVGRVVIQLLFMIFGADNGTIWYCLVIFSKNYLSICGFPPTQLHPYRSACGIGYNNKQPGFLSGFWSRGVKMRCNVAITGGAKLYYIPESKAYDKLGEPGIMLHCAKHNQHA